MTNKDGVSFSNRNERRDNTYSHAAQDLPVLKRVPTQFNGSFEFTGPYRGPPSPEIDKAWDRFTFHRE